MGPIARFMQHHYRHFNAAAMMDAATAYVRHVDAGKPMLVSLAGAMSTAELGLSLAEMIRKGKVHAISCTGANLEEDLYNLVAHDHYVRVPNYRNLSDEAEQELLDRHLNRVTDTCIPEAEAIRRIEGAIVGLWQRAGREGGSHFPHEYFFELIRSGALEHHYQIDPADSWLVAAAEKDLPMVVPGWEDSTTGNIFAARIMTGDVQACVMKSGIDYMLSLADWYPRLGGEHGLGFFQIGGGIAGDFPICVVPMLEQDLETPVPKWSYFCQISDSTTSYGSYSGAVPNEKITWGKLAPDTPRFVIESDASIVAPLVFAYVLDW
jgi:deoxyhypusine synthase